MGNISEKLMELATVLHWLGKYAEANAINRLSIWLKINKINTQEEIEELLASSNDNPNIVPLNEH